MRKRNSEDVFSDKLRFIYLSLPFFKKKESDCKTEFDKWIYVLKHMEVLERMPFAGQKKIFSRLAEIAAKHNLTQQEKEVYDASFDRADDYYSVLESYFDEGASQKVLSVAKNMLAMGMTDSQIAQATGLSGREIAKLKN